MKDDWEDFSDEENLKDENITLIARKFRKFLFNKKDNGKQKWGKKSSTKKKNGIKINLRKKTK